MKTMRIAILFATLVLGMPLLPLLAQDGASTVAPEPASMAMKMESCEHHAAFVAALDKVAKIAADAKNSDDAKRLRGALDQIGLQVAKMQEDAKKCSGMMGMMEKMKSMPRDGGAAQPHH